ncbi:metalloregulator ArsR/SmtB family transcription factor [Ruminococcaceae bacterium OttesenSCG-928-A16]|nr:metalloregulator ArsR/SmtB family transcription factor [Ruminococcaceae bacterium OttesenSCG-928-A16]
MANTVMPHNHGEHLAKILKKMPGSDEFLLAADIFSQLSDATRLRILWLLCHSEECVTNIAAAIGMSDPAVSHHLRILKNKGLVSSRRIGKEVHYTLADTEAAHLMHRMIDDVFEMNCPGCGIR